jgi:hypothetical protein
MKKKSKRKSKTIAKKTRTGKHTDDPYLRLQETSMDLAAEGKSISKLRLAALKQADQMPETDSGGLGQQIPEYVFSQPAIPGQSNWVQM